MINYKTLVFLCITIFSFNALADDRCKSDPDCKGIDEVCFHGTCKKLDSTQTYPSTNPAFKTQPVTKTSEKKIISTEISKELISALIDPPKEPWIAFLCEFFLGAGIGNFYAEAYVSGFIGFASTTVGILGIVSVADSEEANITMIIIGAVGRIIAASAAPLNAIDYNRKHMMKLSANLGIWQQFGGNNRDIQTTSPTFHVSYPVFVW
jgi:hypothetical protein